MSKLSELKPVEQQVMQWLSQMGWELRTPEEMKENRHLAQLIVHCSLYIVN